MDITLTVEVVLEKVHILLVANGLKSVRSGTTSNTYSNQKDFKKALREDEDRRKNPKPNYTTESRCHSSIMAVNYQRALRMPKVM